MNFHPEEKWIDWVDQLSLNDFVVIDDFLSEDLFKRVSAFLLHKLAEDEFDRAGIGSSNKNLKDTSIRGDFTYWLDKDRDQDLSLAFEIIEETKGILNRFCFLSLSGYEFHLAYYPEGTYYKKHLDQFQERSNRMISMIIYLNEGWQKGDGGELKIFREKDEFIIDPLAGRCVMFKSADVPHEVMQTNVGRYSLTGWLLYQPSGVGFVLG
ncbi:2OG-Fe(II) oxygenase [Ekhidna sp. MALMAid0563]|uniref:2OG-Fe(II) oxygenase n=1 Tax=Ekhidna sp. MALMAid0563 TaxID=3143937 RepID=UPI0032DF77F5